jgi:hypothetical protein
MKIKDELKLIKKHLCNYWTRFEQYDLFLNFIVLVN